MKGNSMELNIQRFAEGGSGEGSGESATVAQSQSGAAASAADNASVAGEQSDAQSAQLDLSGYTEEQIEELIEKNSALKKAVGKKMSNSFGKRLAQERAKIQDEMKGVNDVVDKMMVLHGVKSIEELGTKLDEIIPEEYALQNNVSNDVGKELMNARVESLRKDRLNSFYEEQEKVNKQMNEWKQQEAAVKEVFPEFNLEIELGNKDFSELLKRGISMEHAYKVLHHDELMKAAEDRAAKAYSQSVNANLSRPNENGTGNQSAVSGALAASKLTKKDRAELAKRAARGETITL